MCLLHLNVTLIFSQEKLLIPHGSLKKHVLNMDLSGGKPHISNLVVTAPFWNNHHYERS
jgi:hypothetical protein